MSELIEQAVDVVVPELSLFERFCQEYDSKIGELPLPELDRRLELISGLGWRPGDGDIAGHFRGRPLGHRCGWSCNWSGVGGQRWDPQYIFPLEHMRVQQVLIEAEDVADRSPGDFMVWSKLVPALMAHYRGEVAAYGHWLDTLKDCIGAARQNYPCYVAPWSIPAAGSAGQILSLGAAIRPGYGSRSEFLRAMGYSLEA